MSLTSWVTVHCDTRFADGTGCLMWDSDGGGGLTAKDARKKAAAHGWRYLSKSQSPSGWAKDYCPQCWRRDHPASIARRVKP